MNRGAVLAILLGLAVLPALAVPAQERTRSPLESEPRLNQPVSVTTTMITLSRLLARLSEQTGVTLRSDPAIAGDTLFLWVKERPARLVLENLATTLDYSWSKDTEGGFRCLQDQNARNRAARLRQEYRRAAASELDAQLKRIAHYEQEFAPLAPRDRAEALEKLEQRARDLPVGPQQLAAEADAAAAGCTLNPSISVLLFAFYALPESVRERLLAGDRVIMATRQPNAVPMPPGVLQRIRGFNHRQKTGQLVEPPPPQPDQPVEDEVLDFQTHLQEGRLYLAIRGLPVPGKSYSLRMLLPLIRYTPSFAGHAPHIANHLPGRVTAERPEDLKRKIRHPGPSFGGGMQPDEPVSYALGVTLPHESKMGAWYGPREEPVALVGDAYFKGWVPRRFPGTEIAPPRISFGYTQDQVQRATQEQLELRELLELIAELGGVNVYVTKDGWLRFRSTLFFLDRDGQIDPELVRELFRPWIVDARKPFAPDDAMRVHQRLSNAQLATLAAPHLRFAQPPLRGDWLKQGSDGWRLLGALSASSRQTLIERGMLEYTGLSQPEREAVQRFLIEASQRFPFDAPPFDLFLRPEDLRQAVLRLRAGSPESRSLELSLDKASQPVCRAALYAIWDTSLRNPMPSQ